MHAMANTANADQRLNVDVQEVARGRLLVALHGTGAAAGGLT